MIVELAVTIVVNKGKYIVAQLGNTDAADEGHDVISRRRCGCNFLSFVFGIIGNHVG